MLEVGVAADRLACVPNWADTQLVRPVKQNNPFRRRLGLLDRFVVMYSGNIGLTQRLEIVLHAADLLRHREDIVILIVGDGVSRSELVSQAKRRRLPNVRFLPFQPKEQLAESLSAADVHLVPLAEGLPQCLMPSKLYAALASGTPVVAMAPEDCELAQLVQQHGVGIVVPPADHVQLATTLSWLAADAHHRASMGAAARRLAVGQFDRSCATAAFGQLLDSVLLRSSEGLLASSTRHIA